MRMTKEQFLGLILTIFLFLGVLGLFCNSCYKFFTYDRVEAVVESVDNLGRIDSNSDSYDVLVFNYNGENFSIDYETYLFSYHSVGDEVVLLINPLNPNLYLNMELLVIEFCLLILLFLCFLAIFKNLE